MNIHADCNNMYGAGEGCGGGVGKNDPIQSFRDTDTRVFGTYLPHPSILSEERSYLVTHSSPAFSNILSAVGAR